MLSWPSVVWGQVRILPQIPPLMPSLSLSSSSSVSLPLLLLLVLMVLLLMLMPELSPLWLVRFGRGYHRPSAQEEE